MNSWPLNRTELFPTVYKILVLQQMITNTLPVVIRLRIAARIFFHHFALKQNRKPCLHKKAMLKVVLIARLILIAKLKALKNLKMPKSSKPAGQSKTFGWENSGLLIFVCSLSKQENHKKILS